MLEGQQEKLVNALRELYVRNLNHKGWPGPALQTSSKGFPLTHDILERLGLLRLDDHGDCEAFEDDPEKLRRRMMIKDEEHAFPTPSTTQSEFSPIHTPSTDSFPSRLFTKDKVPPVHFQPTPIHSPEEEVTTSFSDGPLGTDTAMCMDSAPLQIPQQTWMQSTANYVGAMDFLPYDVTGSYSSMGGMEQKANPCLPMAWMDDELGPMGLHTALT